jgi:thiamine-triphosphatase
MKTLFTLARSSILEVERKFSALTVPNLTRNSGRPPFRSIESLGQWELHDVYYDKSQLLCTAGIWVRKRNGQWEAKVRRGGDFVNSKFEELSTPEAISVCVGSVIGHQCTSGDNFGLEHMATLSTLRQAWLADEEFKIVLDTLDFGHVVGEVELEEQVDFSNRPGLSVDKQTQQKMEEMDKRITKFMEQYSWAFHKGSPKGKLVAYFERKENNCKISL